MDNPVLDTGTVETVRESIQRARSEVAEKVVAEPIAKVEKTEVLGDAGHKSPQQAQRERDDAGRFAKEQAAKPKPVTAVTVGSNGAAGTSGVEPPKVEPISAPDSWGKMGNDARRKVWEALDKEQKREVLQAIADREKEVHQGFTKFDEERNFAKKVRDVVSPYLPIIRASGVDEVRAIQGLLQTEYALRTSTPVQRAQMYAQLFQQYPADFSVLDGQQPIDPRYSALEQQIAQQNQRLFEMQQGQEARELAQAQVVVNDFSKDKPHFEKLKPAMKALVDSGQASSVEQAYEMAAWQNPEVRSTLIREEHERLAKDQAAKVAQKKAVAVSVKGSPGGENQSADDKPRAGESVRESINRSRRQMSSAA